MSRTSRQAIRVLQFTAPLAVLVITILIIVTASLELFATSQILLVEVSISLAVASLSIILVTWFLRTPTSYNVAIVGFPKSGKTTLIISLFGEAFARKLPLKMLPRGSRTIERINASLEMLDRGKALGPTEDQDLFAFRADITLTRFPPVTYKVEFGDFPGKYSENYAEKYGRWLHTTEFFKWVADSDAIVFVIDLARYFGSSKKNYVASMTSALRAAWQQYLNVNSYRMKEARRHPVVIAFNKADMIQRISQLTNLDLPEQTEKGQDLSIQKKIAELGFGDRTPPIITIDPTLLSQRRAEIETDFAELIDYFRSEALDSHVVFTSSFGFVGNKRLGISELLLHVFP